MFHSFIVLVVVIAVFSFYTYNLENRINKSVEEKVRAIEKEIRKDLLTYHDEIEERISELENIILKTDTNKKIKLEVERQLKDFIEGFDMRLASHSHNLGSSYKDVLTHMSNVQHRLSDLEAKIMRITVEKV